MTIISKSMVSVRNVSSRIFKIFLKNFKFTLEIIYFIVYNVFKFKIIFKYFAVLLYRIKANNYLYLKKGGSLK